MRSPIPPVPSVADVLSVLYRAEPVDVVAAAVHLLTPVTAAGPVSGAHIDGQWVTWRGETVRARGTWPVVAAKVRDLVVRASTPGDRFLTVTDDPRSWVKLVRAGAHVHLHGVAELLGGPLVTFGTGVSVHAAQLVTQLVLNGELPASGRLHLGGVVLSVRADARAAHVDVVWDEVN